MNSKGTEVPLKVNTSSEVKSFVQEKTEGAFEFPPCLLPKVPIIILTLQDGSAG